MLQYHPQQRITALEALCHPFFDPIRDPNTRLPDGQPLPSVLNFSRQGKCRTLYVCLFFFFY
jgi:glycogen synthase kinase 3 beta